MIIFLYVPHPLYMYYYCTSTWQCWQTCQTCPHRPPGTQPGRLRGGPQPPYPAVSPVGASDSTAQFPGINNTLTFTQNFGHWCMILPGFINVCWISIFMISWYLWHVNWSENSHKTRYCMDRFINLKWMCPWNCHFHSIHKYLMPTNINQTTVHIFVITPQYMYKKRVTADLVVDMDEVAQLFSQYPPAVRQGELSAGDHHLKGLLEIDRCSL